MSYPTSSDDGIISDITEVVNGFIYIIGQIWNGIMAFGNWLLMAFMTFCGYLPWLIILGGIYFVGTNTIPLGPSFMSMSEHSWRCDVQTKWKFPIQPMVNISSTTYDTFAPWTNALGFVQRHLTLYLFIDIWGWDFFDWVLIIADLGGNALLDLITWCFRNNVIYNAFPAHKTFIDIANRFVPQSTLLLIKMCRDIRPIVKWIERCLNSEALSCGLHHLTNFVIGCFQYTVSFYLNFMKFLFEIILGGGSGQDLSDILTGKVTGPGSLLLPSFSRDSLKERLSTAGVYAGIFLNDVFAITICSFKSEMNANGLSHLSDALYDSCISSPDNQVPLFGVIGPAVAAFVRFSQLWFAVLTNSPKWMSEIFYRPTGPRYLIDVWYKGMWYEVFDSIRNPPIRYDYSLSVNFPTEVVGSNISSILWPKEELYGPDLNLSCSNYDNLRTEIPCLSCGEVAQYDAQTKVCETCAYLDNITANVANLTFWVPLICCGVASYARVYVAVADFLVGVLVHIPNYDRMGVFLADQNHYDLIADEIGGKPFLLGGLLGCLFQIAHGLDPRLDMIALAIIQPAKAYVEAIRLAVIAVCRFVNDIVGTGEPGFADYICVNNPLNCVETERSLIHLRRPRDPIYNPQFAYVDVMDVDMTPAFVDAACYVLNFHVLTSFMSLPPDEIPDFCCFPHYLFRIVVEQIKLVALVFISAVQSIVSIFSPEIPFNLILVEFIACKDIYTCINAGDLLSDWQDMLACPCLLLLDIQALLESEYGTFAFYCICDFVNGAVQFFILQTRANALILSCLADLMYCVATDWDDVHCNVDLVNRIFNNTDGIFEDIYSALDALATAFSSLGCTLGLPWVALGWNCIGHKRIWFQDSPPCMSSKDGPGICTMSDRLQDVTYYLFQFVLVGLKFYYNRIETFLRLGFGVINAITWGEDPDAENSIAKTIVAFFLIMREPLFGTTNQLVDGYPTVYRNSTGPYDTTGVNGSKVYYDLEVPVDNRTYVLGNWTFVPPPTYRIYNYSFAFYTNTSFNATHGLIQAIGETLNCLAGPDTISCNGPMISGPYPIDGTTGCLGDLPIAAANGFRDVYTAIIVWIGDGLYIIEAVFLIPDQVGEAVKQFIVDFFVIIMLIVKNAEIIITAIEQVIVQVASFIFGDGVGKFIQFVIDVISVVIDVFIKVIQALIAPFLTKKRADGSEFEDNGWTRWSGCTYTEIFLGVCGTHRYSDLLYKAYRQGKDTFYANLENKFGITSKRDNNESTDTGDVKTEFKSFRSNNNNNNDSLFEEKERKRSNKNTQQQQKEFSWKRIYSDEFSGQHAQEMSEGLCKDVMTDLYSKKKFSEFSNPDRALWTMCFTLWSLPNEIYAMSGGELVLPPDFFYNPNTSLPIVSSWIKSVQGYFQWQKQSGVTGFTPLDSQITYTELNPIPEVLSVAIETQNNFYQTILSERDTNDKDPMYHFKRNTLNTENIQVSFTNAFKHSYSKEEKTSKSPTSYIMEDFLGSKNKNFLQEDECYNIHGTQSYYCIDRDKLMPGFTIQLKPTEVHKRDDKKIPVVNEDPFLSGPIQILTSLNGKIAFNLTSTGTIVPVLNGKIPTTKYNYTFLKYLSDQNLDNSINLATFNAFERQSSTYLKENYLRLYNSFETLGKAWYPLTEDENMQENHISQHQEDEPTIPNRPYHYYSRDSNGINNKEKRSPMKQSQELFHKPLTKRDPRYDALMQNTKMKEDKRPLPNRNLKLNGIWKLMIESLLGMNKQSEFQTPSKYPEFGFGKKSNNTISILAGDIKKLVGGIIDIIRNEPTMGKSATFDNNRDYRKRMFEENFNGQREYKYKIEDNEKVINEHNEKHYEAVNEIKKMGVYRHYFKYVIPKVLHHFAKTVKGYLHYDSNSKIHITEAPDSFKNTHTQQKRFHTQDYTYTQSDNQERSKMNPRDSNYWVLNNKGEVVLEKGKNLWKFEPGDDRVFGEDNGRKYEESDLVYVLFRSDGSYKTFKNVYLKTNWDNDHNGPKSGYIFDPLDFITHTKNSSSSSSSSSFTNINVSHDEFKSNIEVYAYLNYYEHYYGTSHSFVECFNNSMWLKKYLVRLENNKTNFFELIAGIEKHVELEELYKEDPNAKIVHIAQCYRKGGVSPEHPHQKKYGHILKGQTLIGHRIGMFFQAYQMIYDDIVKKLSWGNISNNTKKIYIEPWIEKTKETYQVYGRTPTLSKAYFSAERIRLQLYQTFSPFLKHVIPQELIESKNVKTPHTLPTVFLAELGHPVAFPENTVKRFLEDSPEMKKRGLKEEEIQEEMLVQWKKHAWKNWYHSWLDPFTPKDIGESLKRNFLGDTEEENEENSRKIFKRWTVNDAPILHVCLPKNSSNPDNIVTECDECTGCAKRECAYCSNCKGCTFFYNGTSSCDWCSNCRVNGPFCDGGCQNCSGCTTQVACLDCLIVDRVLPPTIFWAYQAAFPTPLERKPGVNRTCVEPFNTSSSFPSISDYAFGDILNWISDSISYIVNYIAGIDVWNTLINWILNVNINPWDDCVGLRYYVIRRIPIPFIYKCNYDADTTGNLGIGLEESLKITLPVTAAFIFAGLTFFPQASTLIQVFAGGNLYVAFIGFTAQVAWNYNPRCYSPSSNILLNFLGYGAFPMPIVPLPAAREIEALVTKIFSKTYWIPACMTTNNISEPATCDDYLNISNFSDVGFTNGFTTLMYIIQAYASNETKDILVDFINSTCFVQGGCMTFNECQASGNTNCVPDGWLSPFYQHNFQPDLDNETMKCVLENTFYWASLSLAELIVPLFLLMLALFGFYFIYLFIVTIFGITMMITPKSLLPGASLNSLALGPNPMSVDYRYA